MDSWILNIFLDSCQKHLDFRHSPSQLSGEGGKGKRFEAFEELKKVVRSDFLIMLVLRPRASWHLVFLVCNILKASVFEPSFQHWSRAWFAGEFTVAIYEQTVPFLEIQVVGE